MFLSRGPDPSLAPGSSPLTRGLRRSIISAGGSRDRGHDSEDTASGSRLGPMSGPLEQLGLSQPIDFIINAPLVEQGPFRPEDLAAVHFRAGTRTMYGLHAPCQSGKSPTITHLCHKAFDAGCWVLFILNINNNSAISNLAEKFTYIHKQLDIRADIITDEIFCKRSERALKNKCDNLSDPHLPSLMICKADEDPLSKLLAHVPAESWSRCVIIFDEVHCFFSLEKDCKKKAELNLCRILFGGDGRENGQDSLATMRVRSVVFSDATDGDLPHVLGRIKCPKEEFKWICADPERLRTRGYVSAQDCMLFKAPDGGPAMVAPFSMWQRYGKDVDQQLPFKLPKAGKQVPLLVGDGERVGVEGELHHEGPSQAGEWVPREPVSGKQFGAEATRAHFAPGLLAFYVDGLEPAATLPQTTFVLELTTTNKSEDTYNSVEYHAQCVSRLFPGVLALAEHGGGCFHVRGDGEKTRYPSHRAASDALQLPTSSPYHGKPKYMITNIGFGSIQYAFPSRPVTHVYIGFKATDFDNLLVKAQGLGRACGYVRDDLHRCGVERVKVMCTEKHFDSLLALSTFTREIHDQYPHHVDGTYTNNIVRGFQLGHRSNPMVALTRVAATVKHRSHGQGACGGGESEDSESRNSGATCGGTATGGHADGPVKEVPPSTSGPSPRRALYDSDEVDIGVELGEARALVYTHGTIMTNSAPESELEIKARYPGITISSKVVFIVGNEKQHLEGVRTVSDHKCKPFTTEIGSAAKALQARVAHAATTNVAHISAERSIVNAKRYNANPAKLGKAGGKAPADSYRMLWGYDVRAGHALGIVRLVSFADLSLPFIYHKMVTAEDGSLGVRAMLVTEGRPNAPKVQKTPRAPKLPGTVVVPRMPKAVGVAVAAKRKADAELGDEATLHAESLPGSETVLRKKTHI